MSCNSPTGSSDSFLSSVSSNELDVNMSETLEKNSCVGNNISGCNNETNSAGNKRSGDAFLACNEDKFPSDSEGSEVTGGGGSESSLGAVRGRRRKGGNSGGATTGANNKGLLLGVASSGGGGVKHTDREGGTPPSGGILQSSLPRYSRSSSSQLAQYPNNFGGSMKPPASCPSVPLGGFKSSTVTRFQPILALDAMLSGENLQKKRRPRLEYSLRICRDFVTDVLSKKHKDWAWPLYKPDRSKTSLFNEPMYLFDIRNKFVDRMYRNSAEFGVDIRKLIDNFCDKFPLGHQYNASARKLGAMFEHELQKFQDSNGRPLRRGANISGATIGSGGSSGGKGPFSKQGLSLNPVDLSKGPSFNGLTVGGAGFEGLTAVPSSWTVPDAGRVDDRQHRFVAEQTKAKEAVGRNDVSMWNLTGNSNMETTFGGSPENRVVDTTTEAEDVRCQSFSESWRNVRGNSGRRLDSDGGSVVGTPPRKRRGADNDDDEDGGGEESRDGGGTEKRARVDDNANLSIVKREIFEQEESRPFSDAPVTDTTRKKFVCKWIFDGIRGASSPERVVQEIRTLLGIPEENFVIDTDFLETLDFEDLDRVGTCVLGMLVGRPLEVDTSTGRRTTDTFHSACKTASDVISTVMAEWIGIDEHLVYLRENAHGMLLRLNKLQEQTFDSMKNLHDCKKGLNECSRTTD